MIKMKKKGMKDPLFFSPNKAADQARIDKLGVTDRRYKNRKPVLARDQVKHISGWKTYVARKTKKR